MPEEHHLYSALQARPSPLNSFFIHFFFLGQIWKTEQVRTKYATLDSKADKSDAPETPQKDTN